MKNILTSSLILVLFISCNHNDFSNTKKYFTTNKDTYRIGDSIEFTVLITHLQKEKTIRFLKKFEIPELKITDSIKKSVLKVKPIITLQGYCKSIYEGTKGYFIQKDVNIDFE
jgi:hypothetical protein